MPAIKGQPQPKPQDLTGPVPGASALDDFMSEGAGAETGAAGSALDDFMAADGGAAPAGVSEAIPEEVAPGYNGFGADALESVAGALPIVGGIVGGIAGGIAGIPAAGLGAVPGGIAGSALGASAGTAYKQLIMQNVLKRAPQQDGMERAKEIGMEGAISGAGSLVGLGVSKGVVKLANTRLGQAAAAKVAEKAAAPLAAIKERITQEVDEIFEPIAKIISTKVTPLTGEEAGNAIKTQLGQDIRKRFSGFVKAYGELDEVAANVPILNDTVKANGTVVRGIRSKFTDKIRNDALDMPPGTYKTVKGYTDLFDQTTDGKSFTKVMSDLRGEAEAAAKDAVKYNSNAVRDRAAALMKFADDAEAFYEDKVIGGIAERVANGKATMAEIEGFQKMMAAQQTPGVAIDPANLSKYTKSVARDYLDQKETVKRGYAQFRGLMEDVGDVTKIKSTRMGPRQFARALDEVPPDVLAERAFDPKNAGAMRIMQKEYPQVYDTIVKNKMSSIVGKNIGTDGTINYQGIAKTLKDMPESSSKLLMKNDEYNLLLKAVNDPRLELLKSEQTGIANRVALGLARIGEMSRVTGKAVARNPGPLLPKTSSAVGQGVFQLGDALRPTEPQE